MRRYLSDEEKEAEKRHKDELKTPEHIPVVPLDIIRERERQEALKLKKALQKKNKRKIGTIITEDGKEKKVTELTIAEQTQEIIRCATDPIYFIENYLTIFDQTQGDGGKIVPFKLFDFQKDLIRAYQNNRFNVVNKYRQAGVSTVTASFIAWYVMFLENRQVAIVANKLETARDELMYDVVEFINSCPVWLRPKTGKDTEKGLKDTQKLKIYDNGSKLGAFSSTGLRGYTPTLIFWDETAHTEKGDKFWLSTYPTLQTGGGAIMVSCVTKDTFIFTDKGIKQISDFIPNETLGTHIINDYTILGKDKLRTSNIFFNNGFVDTLIIRSTFAELESSLNHKYWAYKLKDKKYDWYRASELEIGDYVSVQYEMNIWGNNDDCSDFKPTISPYIQNPYNPQKLTPDVMYLIGLYISEGWSGDIYGDSGNIKTTKFNFTCGDSLHEAINNNDFNHNLHNNIHHVFSSKNYGEFLKYLGFDLTKKAKEKTIPSRLLEASKENIVAMVQGIMDGDGWATYNKKLNSINVGITLSSKKLIEQLRIIFNNFGILTSYSERLTKPTKKVKARSQTYTLNAYSQYAIKYFNEIGFRFERKQNAINKYNLESINYYGGNKDLIPDGVNKLREIYSIYNKRGFLKSMKLNDFKIEPYVTENRYIDKPYNRKNLLKFIDFLKESVGFDNTDLLPIINKNLIWTPIKSIEKSKNWTYDFSLPDNPNDNYDFDHSVIYNQFITHNTPNGLDPVYYKTFEGARRKENNFNAVELWWYNDPRYNKDLVWYKNKSQENEIKLIDDGWTKEHRIKLMDDGWEASSPWFEEQIQNANGDKIRINQELLCVRGDSLITVRNKKTNIVETLKISEFYDKLSTTK